MIASVITSVLPDVFITGLLGLPDEINAGVLKLCRRVHYPITFHVSGVLKLGFQRQHATAGWLGL